MRRFLPVVLRLRLRYLLMLMLAVVLGATSSTIAARVAQSAPASPGTPKIAGRWVGSWVSMPQLTEPNNLPPEPFTQPDRVLEDATLRQTIRVTVGGPHLRLRFSNAFGTTELPITKVAIALPDDQKAGVSAIEPSTSRPVTFSGRASTTIQPGAQVVSDPLNFSVASKTILSVTIYLAEGQASQNNTSHPGSRTTSYLVKGDHVAATDLTGSTPTDHWYFLSGLEVWTKPSTSAVVMLGDSLTDGRGSTTNGNDRWPDQLFDRLQRSPSTSGIAVGNQAAGGNRVLRDGLGPSGLARLDRDVLAYSGISWLLVFEGVNDIGTAAATPEAQKQVRDELIAAYNQIIVRAHAQGIRVYGATITAFGGNEGYDDPDGFREATRQAVNQWIRTSRRFDAVIDFDKVSRDPANPRQLLPAYDTGDHLHLNQTGYKALADSVPAGLFRNQPLPPNFTFN